MANQTKGARMSDDRVTDNTADEWFADRFNER